jgi:excisionase family DNA binding protein
MARAKFLTPPQAAEILGVNTDRLRRWIRNGQLRAVNVSDAEQRPRWRIDPEDFNAFLASRGSPSVPAKRSQFSPSADVREFV